ncbi:MAG: sulfotransferase [Streptosporangiales bacterium]|nr:sulfotransferase [Streptosporangiales bacterium]
MAPVVVFVGGLGRSGSTLLERLLGELPGVCSIGETVHMWRRALVDDEPCGCGEAFSACPFWGKVGEVAFGGWDRVDPATVAELKGAVDRTRFLPRLTGATLGASLRAGVERYTEPYLRLYAAVREVSGAPAVVDSSKHASLAACLRWADGVDLRVLHVVRDPRAVAYAWTKRIPRPDATPTSPEQFMATYRPPEAAAHWLAQNTAFDRLAARGVPTLRIRYEDFVADPSGHLRQAARFAGVPEVPAGTLEGGVARLTPTHTVSGNPMRFRTGELAVRADEAWRTAPGAARRALVSLLTLPLRRRYDY